ncbi:hypothetical protein EMIT047CA2_110154 [Pseudomonas soli]
MTDTTGRGQRFALRIRGWLSVGTVITLFINTGIQSLAYWTPLAGSVYQEKPNGPQRRRKSSDRCRLSASRRRHR